MSPKAQTLAAIILVVLAFSVACSLLSLLALRIPLTQAEMSNAFAGWLRINTIAAIILGIFVHLFDTEVG